MSNAIRNNEIEIVYVTLLFIVVKTKVHDVTAARHHSVTY